MLNRRLSSGLQYEGLNSYVGVFESIFTCSIKEKCGGFFFLNLQMLSVLFALISEMVLVEMKFPECLVVALYQVHSVFMLFFTQIFCLDHV